MKKICVFLSIILFCTVALSQQKNIQTAAEKVNKAYLKKYLEFIASDKCRGRLTGTKGNERALKYAARHFKRLKLKPVCAPEKRGISAYFQEFEFESWWSKKIKTKNVVAMLEGRDEKLKDEIVVIGAHIDHIGMKRKKPKPGEDIIYNGADDNGSGSAVVMEVARVFAKSGYRPKRSILFILFNAEEMGLKGSYYYVENPVTSLKKHIALINIDMVGRSKRDRVWAGGVGTGDLWEKLIKKCAKRAKIKVAQSKSPGFGSDHVSFVSKKIPAIHLCTGGHRDLHGVNDEVEKINFDGMQKICKFVVYLAGEIADHKQTMKWVKSYMPSWLRYRKRLGVYLEDLPDDELDKLGIKEKYGAVKIIGISKGSVGWKGGLRKGDIIIKFNKKNLPRKNPQGRLRKLIAQAKYNKKIPIEIVRGQKRIKIYVIWKKKEKKKY
jgi:hypothetical protein